jgi:hypothetical protein
MTELKVQEAIEIITMEMFDNRNPYVQVVGKFLSDYINNSPECGEKFVDSKKTLSQSLLVMKKEAEKVKVDNVAVLTDEQGFEIVLKFFGFIPGGEELAKLEDPKPKVTQPAQTKAEKTKKTKKKPETKTEIKETEVENVIQPSLFDDVKEGEE